MQLMLMSSLCGSCISNSNCYSSISVLSGWDWWVLIRTIHSTMTSLSGWTKKAIDWQTVLHWTSSSGSNTLWGYTEGKRKVFSQFTVHSYIGLKDSLSNHPPCYISVISFTDVQQHDTVKAKELCNTICLEIEGSLIVVSKTLHYGSGTGAIFGFYCMFQRWANCNEMQKVWSYRSGW